ncbi:hypothetical protein HNY73_014288 [Argiope bruennichi]|uniref:Uncharacterized protein n=1 Tax=Argiope bruennichi TaxID=94029 RepID=A0A8T0ENF1_ARGBR|nr:hypothetical protein HNY73_014288 [Argiope bruennichi]
MGGKNAEDAIFLISVGIQTINQDTELNMEKVIQTDSKYFNTRGIQTVNYTKDKQTQGIAKHTVTVASQTESILPTSEDSYKEDKKSDKMIDEEESPKETEESHSTIDNNSHVASQNINGEEATYFNLSSLSVLSTGFHPI